MYTLQSSIILSIVSTSNHNSIFSAIYNNPMTYAPHPHKYNDSDTNAGPIHQCGHWDAVHAVCCKPVSTGVFLQESTVTP